MDIVAMLCISAMKIYQENFFNKMIFDSWLLNIIRYRYVGIINLTLFISNIHVLLTCIT